MEEDQISKIKKHNYRFKCIMGKTDRIDYRRELV